MNKRIRKKEYKAILEAKDRMNTWNIPSTIFNAILDGYVNPETRNTREGRAIRKVVSCSGLDREWKGWGFSIPKTSDAMKAIPSYNLTIYGKLYAGRHDFAECQDASLTINFKRLFTDEEYVREIMSKPEGELLRDLVHSLLDVA